MKAMLRRRTLVCFLAAALCGGIYAWSWYKFWQPALCATDYSQVFQSNRASQWLDLVLHSSFLDFPRIRSGGLARVTGTSLCDFHAQMTPSENAPTALVVIADDMGLPYAGLLLNKLLGFDRVFLAHMWWAILLQGFTLFAFCFAVFRLRAWLPGLALTAAAVSSTSAVSSQDILWWGPWQPYGYALLFPIAVFLLLQLTSSMLDNWTQWREQALREQALKEQALKEQALRVTTRPPARRKSKKTSRRSAPSTERVSIRRRFGGLLREALSFWRVQRPAAYLLWIGIVVYSAALLSIRGDGLINGSALVAGFFIDRLVRCARKPTTRQLLYASTIVIPLAAIIVANSFIMRSVLSKPYQQISPSSHVFWHTIWCSLGEYPNSLQFKWNDRDASMRAEKIAGRPVETFSLAYEQVLRQDVLDTLRTHPGAFGAILLRKLAYRVSDFLRAFSAIGSALVLWIFASRPWGSAWIASQLRVIVLLGLGLLASRMTVLLSSAMPFYTHLLELAQTFMRFMEPTLVVFAALLMMRYVRSRQRSLPTE
jgi:hypothetical protein